MTVSSVAAGAGASARISSSKVQEIESPIEDSL